MASRGPSVHQTRYRLLCEALREVLHTALDTHPGDRSGLDSVGCRAMAALYLLLLDHPVDVQGRCRSCRRPGAVFGRRWRHCRIHGAAILWLQQPATIVGALLAHELGHEGTEPPRPGAHRDDTEDVEDTEVLPRNRPPGGGPPPPRSDRSSLLLTGGAPCPA